MKNIITPFFVYNNHNFQIPVYKTHRDGHIHIVHQQSKEGEGDGEDCCSITTALRKVSGRHGQGSQRQAVTRQSPHQACAEVSKLQTFGAEVDKAYW